MARIIAHNGQIFYSQLAAQKATNLSYEKIRDLLMTPNSGWTLIKDHSSQYPLGSVVKATRNRRPHTESKQQIPQDLMAELQSLRQEIQALRSEVSDLTNQALDMLTRPAGSTAQVSVPVGTQFHLFQ